MIVGFFLKHLYIHVYELSKTAIKKIHYTGTDICTNTRYKL
jgi:hypothetical protein